MTDCFMEDAAAFPSCLLFNVYIIGIFLSWASDINKEILSSIASLSSVSGAKRINLARPDLTVLIV